MSDSTRPRHPGRRPRVLYAALALALAAGCASGEAEPPPREIRAPAPAAAASPSPAPAPALFDTLFARLQAESGGILGIAAIHLESGQRVEWNGGERFPMASVVKVPIAIEVLHQVDRGEIALDDTVRIGLEDLRFGRSLLGGSVPVDVSIGELLGLMLQESDNTSADALLGLVGGPAAVRARVEALGSRGIDVSRTLGGMLADWAGLPPAPEGRDWSRAEFDRLLAAVTPEDRRRAAEAWAEDPRDTATPAGMADLLAALHRGAGLSLESRWLLIGHLRGSYGAGRLAGLLPPGTPIAHKSGTGGATTNDVGVVTLPDGGRLAIAVFIKKSERPVPERERAIAQAARALHDHFAAPGGEAQSSARAIVPPPSTRSPS